MLWKFRASCLIILTLFAVQAVYSQGNATIVGIVNDSSGGVVLGAEVTLTNEGTGLNQIALTDSAGRYNFPRLPVGNYRLNVVFAGFKKVPKRALI